MSIADDLEQELTPEQRAKLDGEREPAKRVTAHRPATDGPFARANAVPIAQVCDALGIENDGKTATCPNCSSTDASLEFANGLKCLHKNRCGSKGKSGFRNAVGLVTEVRRCDPKDAVSWMAERFGFEGFTAKQSAEKPKSDEQQIVWLEAREIFAELPPTPWLVRELQICPGRPALWCGYGFVGKTLTAQSKELSIATGTPIFGRFDCQQGIVRHFDHEQGRHATLKRFQRLAFGMGIDPPDTDGRLFVTIFPPVYLNMAGAVDVYSRLCEGTAYAVVDALRGATPGEDENDSKIARCLEHLTHVSERTGTVFEVIHHSGKPQEGHSDQRTKPRGSSAIFNACGAVFIVSGTKNAPKLVSQEKAPAEADGGAVEDFYLVIEDVADGIHPRSGVRVVYRSKAEHAQAPSPTADLDRDAAKIIALVTEQPGLSKRRIRATAGMRASRVDDVLALLVEDGRLESRGGERNAVLYYPAGGVQ